MEEKTLIYQDHEFDKWCKLYQWMQGRLQKLADGLAQLGIEPTDNHIKRLLNGESLEGLMAEKTITGALGQLPNSLLQTIKGLFEKERKDDYNEAVGNEATKLVEWRARNGSTTMINFAYYHIENGKVVIAPEYKNELEKLFCVYVDTESRKGIYNKWLQLLKAKTEFEEAVMCAPKTKPTQTQEASGFTGDSLLPIATPGQFSLVKVRYDGEMILNGEYFSLIQ